MYQVSVKVKCLVQCLKNVLEWNHLYQDAIDFMLPDAYTTAIEETGIEPVIVLKLMLNKLKKVKTLFSQLK